MLKIEHISKTFNPGTVNEKQAIRDLSLNLEKGDFATIIGSNGAGKSTLFNAICGDFFTDSGVIMLDGQDITFMPQHVRAKTIGRLYQDPMRGTAPGMTIEENLALAAGKGGWLSHVSRQEKERFHEELKLLDIGLEKRMTQPVGLLSGGQRQRVMIAMALVCKPEILIADEPTTALDVTIQAQILDLMNQLKKETGTSILFITHDLGVVAEVCDDVAVMYCGRVVERGDVKTIFANPSHPYTKGLLGSIPRLGDAGKELKSIPGNVPNPKYMPKGCKFEPRCPYASEKCREEEPGFFQIEEGHISRCWLCESGQLKTDHVEKAGD